MAHSPKFELAIQASKLKRNERFRQRNLSLFKEAGLLVLDGDPCRKNNLVTFQCAAGHRFQTKVEYVVRGLGSASKGCQRCRDLLHSRKARLQFEKELEEQGYDLLEPYKDARTKLKIRRKSDGAINHITRNEWTAGKRWLKPASKLLTAVDMQDFLDIRKPGYRVVDASQYRSKYDPVTVTCAGQNDKQEIHTYTAQWQIVQYYECKECAGAYQSKEEVSFRKEIEEAVGIKSHAQYPILGTRSTIDLCFPEQGVAIEYCGLWFHSTEFKKPSDHLKKLLRVNGMDLRLLTVFEDEWKERRDIVLSKVRSVFKQYDRIVYARQCEVRELSRQEARGFFNDNHLQGYVAQKVCFGLFHRGELLGAMSFGSFTRAAPSDRGVVLELKRLAFKKGISIVGGSSRLFKRGYEWAKLRDYRKLISFADLRWSEGGIYRVLGFELKTRYIRPSKHYYKGHRRWNAQTLKLKPEERLLGKSERALRLEQGFRIIYDCGHQRWEKAIE